MPIDQERLVAHEEEPTAEIDDGVSFGEYREVVAALSPAFRDIGGLLEEGAYRAAMADPRTVKLRIGDNAVLPFLVPMEHTIGYDVPRTCTLTECPDTYMLAVPVNALTALDVELLEPAQDAYFDSTASAIVVETDHEETDLARQVLPEVFSHLGSFKPKDFLDVRIDKPERQPATMAMYETRFVSVDDQGEALPRRDISFYQAYQELADAGDPLAQQTRLIDVYSLREDPALVEGLWELYGDRFEWLGDYHPISMEDTREFFMQVLYNEDTHTVVRYDDQDKPACLGFFLSGLDECSWISQEYRDKLKAESNEREEELLFFYGIASRLEAVRYAQDVMQLLAHVGQRIGGEWRMLFESTNMSSLYIPRLVNQYVGEGEGVKMTEPVRHMDRMDYWCLVPADQVEDSVPGKTEASTAG